MRAWTRCEPSDRIAVAGSATAMLAGRIDFQAVLAFDQLVESHCFGFLSSIKASSSATQPTPIKPPVPMRASKGTFHGSAARL